MLAMIAHAWETLWLWYAKAVAWVRWLKKWSIRLVASLVAAIAAFLYWVV